MTGTTSTLARSSIETSKKTAKETSKATEPLSLVPKVTIGLPVYNGEPFIQETLDSILAQTFTDFELIISDNASTDETEKICRHYLSLDKRIRYIRNDVNIGAAKNYNQLVPLARGLYFRWAAADDLIAPTYLQTCVSILDHNPDVAVAHTAIRLIDEHGKLLQDYDDELHFISEQPHERLQRYLFRKTGMWNAIFGLVRTEWLRTTKLCGSYVSSDKVLLGEWILKGKLYQVPERLFFRRIHPGQACGAYLLDPKQRDREIAAWFDPLNKNKFIFPVYVRHFPAYLSNVSRVPMSVNEKLLCYSTVCHWAFYKLIWLKVVRKAKKLQGVYANS